MALTKAGGTTPAVGRAPAGAPEVPVAAAVGDAVPVSARTASMSLALPVSIISAPAPTVTMIATGTPIAAACNARRRRAPVGLLGTDQDLRAAAASLTDPCQARKSSSGSLSRVPPVHPGVTAPSAPARSAASGACRSSATGAPSGIRPLPAGQACPGNPSGGYSLQDGPGRQASARPGWARPAAANRVSAGPTPVNHVSAGAASSTPESANRVSAWGGPKSVGSVSSGSP